MSNSNFFTLSNKTVYHSIDKMTLMDKGIRMEVKAEKKNKDIFIKRELFKGNTHWTSENWNESIDKFLTHAVESPLDIYYESSADRIHFQCWILSDEGELEQLSFNREGVEPFILTIKYSFI